jgi:hypothetical protein
MCGLLLNSLAIDALSRQQFEMQQRKIDFFIALHRAVGKAGIGLPAKSRAPALVAGWAPRISQNRASVPDYLITNANATALPMPDKAPVIHTRRSLKSISPI